MSGLELQQRDGHGGGYASSGYCASLAFLGELHPVPAWGTPVIMRKVPGSSEIDVMGPYPLCTLRKEADIAGGLAQLRSEGAVSVVFVADPIGGPPQEMLVDTFEVCRNFKTHYVMDRALGSEVLSKHHRDRIRRGERRAHARCVDLRDPIWRQHWIRLYDELVRKKGITGLQAFCTDAFDRLCELSGSTLIAFAAESEAGEVLAMQLWICDGVRAYSHLTATSEAGYKAGATYVIYAAAIRFLKDFRILDFGGGAGHIDDPGDSLASFKRGFANDTRMAVLCGTILAPKLYSDLCGERVSAFFPAYRA